MNYADLIALLRDLRIQRGLSQAELARRRGVTAGAQHHHESGLREPKYSELQSWARELGAEIRVVTDDEREVIDLIKTLSPEQRLLLKGVAEAMTQPKK